MTENRKVKVLFDYAATDANQLSLKAGDEIEQVKEEYPGWWSGVLNGKSGIFPSNYTKRLYLLSVKALYDYKSVTAGELSFTAGEIFVSSDQDESGEWWKGKKPTGAEGWFPASYVKEIDLGLWKSEKGSQVPASKTDSKKPSSSKKDEPTSSKKTELKPLKTQPTSGNTKPRGFITVQVLEAKNLLAADSNGKSDPYVNLHMEADRSSTIQTKPIFTTAIIPKTLDPIWNEQFKIVVYDPESSKFVLEIYDHDRIGSDDYLGECVFSLKAVERTIDEKQDKWYPVTGKKATGEIHLVIQYEEASKISNPTDVQHLTHVGFTPGEGFNMKNLPQEWIKIFQAAGIKKKELENPETAKVIMGVIQEALAPAATQTTGLSQKESTPTSGGPPPPASGPPPPPSGGPPPPSNVGGPPAPSKAPSKAPTAAKPPSGDLMQDLVKKRAGTLRHVTKEDVLPPLPDDHASTLEKSLTTAMAARRAFLDEGSDDDASDDDVEWT